MKLHNFLLFSLPLLLFGFTGQVFAQTSGLSISPPVVEVLLSPNKKVVQAFTITNQGESSQFVANLHRISPLGPHGQVAVAPQPIRDTELPLLVTLENAHYSLGQPFALAEGQATQLVLGLEGPTSDVSLDTYLALVVSPVYQGAEVITSISGISSLILTTLTPTGALDVNLELTNFDLPLIHDSSTPLSLTPLVTNHAGTMLRVTGNLTVISPLGEERSQLELAPTLILAAASRQLQGTADSGQNSIPLVWEPHPFSFGPYRLKLSVMTLGGTTIQEVEKMIFLFPLKTTLLIILFGLWLMILVLKKKKTAIDSPTQNH